MLIKKSLPAIILIFTAAACRAGGNKAKNITVTNITGKTGEAGIMVLSSFKDDGVYETYGKGSVLENTVTFSLRDMTEDSLPWLGKGNFYLILMFQDDESKYVYTDGKTLSALGIKQDAFTTKLSKPEGLDAIVPKYSIDFLNNLISSYTISFNKFMRVE